MKCSASAWTRVAGLVLMALSFGCSTKGEDTPFIGPIDATDFPIGNSKYCKLNANNQFDDKVTVSKGDNGKFYFGEGGACVFRDICSAWAELNNIPQMQWTKVSHSSFQVLPPPSGVDLFYSVNYVVNDVVTVDWDMDWYHSVTRGTKDDPNAILINYQKVRGTKYIAYWRGSIVLEYVAPGVTAIAMRDELKSESTSPDNCEGAIRQVIDKVRNGSPNLAPLQCGKD